MKRKGVTFDVLYAVAVTFVTTTTIIIIIIIIITVEVQWLQH